MTNTVVVIGAGVIGLTSALLLAKEGNKVTVVGKHMPGDYDAEYASPWAGANVIPLSPKDASRWERRTWIALKKLVEETPEAGIHFQTTHVLRRNKDTESAKSGFSAHFYADNPWFKEIFNNFRNNHPSEVATGYDSGFQYQGVCINTAIYLPWLLGQCLKHGVVVKRAILTHINEAKYLSHTGEKANIIVNATGLGSLKLGGVQDTTVAPARGQIVLVRNETPKNLPLFMCSSALDESGEEIYAMQRAAGGGTVIGGTYQIGNWDTQPDPNIANRIMQRIVDLCPDIAGGKGITGLSIIRHGVGFRPYRKGGLRLEEEKLDDETWVIHNYGHSGWGYMGSYGCAEGVVELVEKVTNKTWAKL
ncbi:D-amino-acid oxidase [Fusarium oxysporum f. sp. raphani 54005]|uniref:D-amino-acid oxidase n=2 Tax=Fusarium oxysporum f. sp. raphani TaxID=96318 RepID=X0CRA4_FUSOX|nr:D-amino-acid oxidase [Fusarium oxysporum f. sp. raphani 54005]KAG7438854.1 D-amino-acid oxidase [Fusarium oxysporum f. sp. raphani]KAJ4031807.1 D-amino acid oxidase [Fusarium oxysporum]KAJ4075787.1 D-amino acid oxidase [Fusarium oxysporum]